MYKIFAVGAIVLCAFVIVYAISIYFEIRRAYPKKDPKALY
jgi:hypothetical protein